MLECLTTMVPYVRQTVKLMIIVNYFDIYKNLIDLKFYVAGFLMMIIIILLSLQTNSAIKI